MPTPDAPSPTHHGPNAFSCGHAFGTRKASGPNFKKAASFFSMALVPLHPRGCCALCNTANPTKPISIAACYLLLPRLRRLYHQTNCIHGNHRRSSLGDSKNHPVSLGGVCVWGLMVLICLDQRLDHFPGSSVCCPDTWGSHHHILCRASFPATHNTRAVQYPRPDVSQACAGDLHLTVSSCAPPSGMKTAS